MAQALNGDLSVRVSMDSNAMAWTPSPSGTVWRKRLHLVGPAESGQVTSVVRYEPESRFAPHDHPEGEEILVLDGVFSDEHGDWPAGTYLLNPEGFRHAPFSRPGCLIFVKLRQFPDTRRTHVVIDTRALPWQPASASGVSTKLLYQQQGFRDRMRLERWAPETRVDCTFADGAELFVVAGAFEEAQTVYGAGSWLRLPPASELRARSSAGCELYVKEGGVAYLREDRS